MASVPPQSVQIRCQNCQTPFTTPVWSLIDVGAQPELKSAFISGQINVAVCPNCGMGGMLATPLAYHDPQHKLFLVLVPQELNLPPQEQERFIGEVSRVVMAGLPDDTPKGYLLTPRQFMTLQTLMETVMEAEGISKEALREQQTRMMVLSELAEAFERDLQSADPEASPLLAAVVERHKEHLTYEFFLTLTAYIDAAEQQGRAESATMLAHLRERVMQLANFDAVAAGLEAPALETVIAALEAASAEQLDETIANYRPMLDDELWEAWSSHVATLEGAAAAASGARLAEVQSTVERMDAEAQAIFEAATDFVREVLGAEDPKAVLAANRDKINDAFMLVLEANMNAAARAGQMPVAQQLDQLRHLGMQVLEEAMSPNERLINQLLAVETAGDATKLLRKHMGQVNQDFVREINELIEKMDAAGRKEAVERLRQVARESASLLF